jgi:hypothetical protein
MYTTPLYSRVKSSNEGGKPQVAGRSIIHATISISSAAPMIRVSAD